MTDPRSAIRFRVPRLRPSIPPRTTITTTTRTSARRPPLQESPTPPPIQPQRTTLDRPSTPVVPSPTPLPPPQEPPAPAPLSQEALPPAQLPQESPTPAPLPREPPSSPPPSPVGSRGTVPAPPPVEPSPSPPPSPQEPASVAPTPIQPAPPPSPSQPRDTTNPPAPSTRLQPISQPSSPQHPHPSPPPQVKKSTEIDSNSHEKGSDHALNGTPVSDSTSESDTKENHRENKKSTRPKTEPTFSHPDDKIPIPESPEPRKPNEPNSTKQFLNEQPANITLAGENRGTSMRIGSSTTNRKESIPIYRRYKVNPGEITDTTTDGEEENDNDSKADEHKEQFPYVNCNIQGINNSVVFKCMIIEKSPGVHFGSFDGKNAKIKYAKSAGLKKVKVNISQPQKQRIRRRCLRGLFMESSDSDKPTRHGCRYIREDERNRDDKADV